MSKWTRRGLIGVMAALVAGPIVVMALSWPLSKDQPQALPPGQIQAAALENGAYLLKEYDGVIAIYRAEELNTPERLTEIQTATLRQADRQSLREGIFAANTEQLLMLLEDFGS